MIILYLEIVSVILLTLYYLFWFVHDCIYYDATIKAMRYVRSLFKVASCVIDEEEGIYTLQFSQDMEHSEKELQAIIQVFKQFYLKEAIVSLEEKGKEFAPCFQRDMMNGIMKELLDTSGKLILAHREWDIFTRFFLKNKYNLLQEEHDKFVCEQEKVSKVEAGKYFQIASLGKEVVDISH